MHNNFREANNLKVTKANRLVEAKFSNNITEQAKTTIIETATKLSLKEQKIILAVVSQISPEDDDFRDYKIPVSQLMKIIKTSDQTFYRDIKKVCKKLVSTTIEIKRPENPDGCLITPWFSQAEYWPSHGYVEFCISKGLKPYLLQLQNRFTTYHLKQVMDLQSTYSIRVYELLRQFLPLNSVKQGKNVAYREITIDDLRGYLGIDGDKYSLFSNLRRRVIDKAQEELEAKTDLKFFFEPIRQGRKIHAIKFTIYNNEHFVEKVDDDMDVEIVCESYDEKLATMVQMNIEDITTKELNALMQTYPKEALYEGVFDLIRAQAKGETINNPKAYYFAILKNKRQEDEEPQTNGSRDWANQQLLEL